MYVQPGYGTPIYSSQTSPRYSPQVSSFSPHQTSTPQRLSSQQANISTHRHQDYRDQTPESKEQHSRLHRSFTPTVQDKTLEATTPSKSLYQQGSPAYRNTLPQQQSSYQTSTPQRQPYHQNSQDSFYRRTMGAGHPLARSCDNFKPLMQGILPQIPPNKKYTLVLDLDETLIHCFDILSTKLNFYTRPKCHDFLEEVSEYFDLVIFTAASKEYAEPIINHLDKKKLINHRLFRESMQPYQGLYVKDLSVLGRDLGKTILVDNLASNFAAQPMNGYLIKDFLGLRNDNEFEDLLIVLRTIIQRQADVRDILPIRNSIIQQYRADQKSQKLRNSQVLQQEQQKLRQSQMQQQQQKQKSRENSTSQQNKLRESMVLQQEKQKQERLLIEKLKQKEAEEKQRKIQEQDEKERQLKLQKQQEEAEKIKQQQLKLQEQRQQQLQRAQEIERKKKEEIERKKKELQAERAKQLKLKEEREKKQKEEIERKKREIEAERAKQTKLQQIYEQQQLEKQRQEDIKRQNLISSVIEQVKQEQQMKQNMNSRLKEIQQAEREQEEQDNQQIKKLLQNMKNNEQQLLETQSQNNNNFSSQNTIDNTPQNESVDSIPSNNNNKNNFQIGEQQVNISLTDLGETNSESPKKSSPQKKKNKKKIFEDIFTNSDNRQQILQNSLYLPGTSSLSVKNSQNFGQAQRNSLFHTPKGRDIAQKSSNNLFFTPSTNTNSKVGNFSTNAYQVQSLVNSVDKSQKASSNQASQIFSQNPYSFANINGTPLTLQNLNLSVNLNNSTTQL